MTIHVNIARAKATLSELVAKSEAGEEVVLMRAGKPVARISPLTSPDAAPAKRVAGRWMKYGPPPRHDLFLERDPELEELMDKSIWPET